MLKTLVLVPTEMEREALLRSGPLEAEVQLCGFGVALAGIRTAVGIHEHHPNRVILAGIAGTYDASRAPLGSCFSPHWVTLSGVGVGEGAGYRSASVLGFPLWPGDANSGAIGERLPLAIPHKSGEIGLLTVCAASMDREQAQERSEAINNLFEYSFDEWN